MVLVLVMKLVLVWPNQPRAKALSVRDQPGALQHGLWMDDPREAGDVDDGDE